MRIFVATGIFHPDTGGPATYLYRFLPELQARGHEIRLLSYGTGPTSGYPYPVRRIAYDPLPVRMSRYALAYRQDAAWADLIFLSGQGLPRIGDRGKPRLLKIVGDYAWERSMNRGWIAPTELLDEFQTRRYGPLVEWMKANRRRAARSVDAVLVPSQYLRDMVAGWGVPPERIHVIYNALDVQHYAPDLDRAGARARLGWQSGGRYVLSAGRLIPHKGFHYLIDAVAALSAELPDLRLVIAGDGPQANELRERATHHGIADRVTLLGKVAHDDLALYMRAADCLALYSSYEGLSHTLLEALYAGTPVIASARGGNVEVVRNGENGFLVPHPDLPALVAALRRLFTDDTRDRLAAGTSAGLERFAWPTLVEQTVQLIEKVAHHRGM